MQPVEQISFVSGTYVIIFYLPLAISALASPPPCVDSTVASVAGKTRKNEFLL
jgi:hypothetical protein